MIIIGLKITIIIIIITMILIVSGVMLLEWISFMHYDKHDFINSFLL